MSLLGPEDLAYLRATQREAQPSAGLLFGQTRVADGKGGHTQGYPTDGTPVMVRLNMAVDQTSAGDIPTNLADRYQATDLIRVHADADAAPLRVHDRLTVAGTNYTLVSDGFVAAWSTAQVAWAVLG